MIGLARLLAVVAAWVLLAGTAAGQIAAGGYADGKPANEHGWAVTPSNVSTGWGLWHIPPRFGRGGADDGAVRIVDSLERAPAAMAASGGRVWMAFAGSGNRAGYGLLSAAVQRGSIDGTWYTGSGGRLASAAFLATRGRLISMTAGPRGPVALLDDSEDGPRIAWLERGAWHWAVGPAGDSPDAVGIVEDGELCLAALGDGWLTMWRAALPELEAGGGRYELIDPDVILQPGRAAEGASREPVELAWSMRRVRLPERVEAQTASIAAGPVGIGSRIVLAIDDGSRVGVYDVHGDELREAYSTEKGAVALLAGARRGLVVRLADEPEGTAGRAATRLEIEEFSLDTGRVFYQGPAVFDGPVSPSDIRILLVLLVLISATLLLFVVRTSGESELFLAPPGCVLAPAMPRLLASATDGLLALLLGGELARLLPEGWLAMRVGADTIDFAPLLMALVVGFLASSVLEALFGRTPGKLIFGLFVSRTGLVEGMATPPRRAGIGAAMARNAVKWLLPLVALAGATSPSLRHRGDTLAGLGVIAQAVERPDGGQSDQDRGSDDR
jgi:hypothetical protein